MKRTFSGAYCAVCEQWQRTSVPVPALKGVHACETCAAELAQPAVCELAVDISYPEWPLDPA